ncbi:hypothetical protein GGR25_001110 [Kaistia hirudinis]|uniref:Uncharacterized protein n=1 Tax=Kaistia hirudinis TaxID=1293440 RepID=A0A840AMF0_9HYPH|nr:hypothetical protein [Kaistia hirudinis]MBB3930071.1 hypothetical protein [Kaistia hirudinis]
MLKFCPHCGHAIPARLRRPHRYAALVHDFLRESADVRRWTAVSLVDIGVALKLTRQQVRRAVASLVDHGQIRVHARFDGDGTQLANAIEVLADAQIAPSRRRAKRASGVAR